jgi:hypothetical protein
MSHVHRIVRVRIAAGGHDGQPTTRTRVLRTSNAYHFATTFARKAVDALRRASTGHSDPRPKNPSITSISYPHERNENKTLPNLAESLDRLLQGLISRRSRAPPTAS